MTEALVVPAALVIGFVLAAPFFLEYRESRSGREGVGTLVSTHDLVQHIAVMEDFDKALRSGVLYPRWLPDMNNGYGNPWMNYYPPGFFYLASLVKVFFGNWADTLFFISVLGFAASGLAFYLLSRLFYGRAESAIAALFYMALPYHVLNLYWQGAMPQLLGFTFLPLVLYFAFRSGAFGRARDYAGLGLCYGLYLITHAPVSFLMTYAIAFYGLVWAARQRDWRVTVRIAIGMSIGLLVGAIYLLPAALETGDIQEHFSGLFPYDSSYITLLPLQGFGDLLNKSFMLQALAIIAAVVILRPAARRAGEDGEAGALPAPAAGLLQTRLWIVMSVATTFMSTSFSIYISNLLPKIQVATFAWRWLAIAGLFVSLLVAAAADRLRDRSAFSPVKLWAWRAAMGAVIVFNIWFAARGVLSPALLHLPHVQPANYVEAGFTPRGSAHPQNLPATGDVVMTPDSGTSEVVRWEPSYREVVVNAKEPGTVRLKTYNFPGWAARLDGQSVLLSSDGDGVQLIEVPPGIHRLEVSFNNTPVRTLGAALTGAGFLAIAGLASVSVARRKRGARAASDHEPVEDRREAGRVWAGGKAKRLAFIGLALVLGLVALVVATGILRPAKRPASGNNTAPPRGEVSVGSEAKLEVQGVDLIPVAVDDAALSELMRALPARDQNKIEGLVQAGKVLHVPNGVRVRILEFGPAKTKVRILEGDNITKEGWVQERWIR